MKGIFPNQNLGLNWENSMKTLLLTLLTMFGILNQDDWTEEAWLTFFECDSVKIVEIPDSIYFNYVLNDMSFQGGYLAIDVIAPNYSGRVITQSHNLHHAFRKYGYTKEQFIEYMMHKLINKDSLYISNIFENFDTTLFYRYFKPVKKIAEVDEIGILTKSHFISYFFKCNTSNSGILNKDKFLQFSSENYYNYERAIINKLFELRIYVANNCYTGALWFSSDLPQKKNVKIKNDTLKNN